MNKETLINKTSHIRLKAGAYLQAQKAEFTHAADSPLDLAAAFALGTLTSFLPVPILDSLLAVGLALKFARLNKAAIFLARAVWNDLLVFPLYAPGLKVGRWVLSAVFDPTRPLLVTHTQLTLLASFLLGVIILASCAAVSGFVAVLLLAGLIRWRKLK